MKSNVLVVVMIILCGALMRWIPHLPNFSPIAAMALLSGVYIRDNRLAFLVPFVSLILGDIVIGFHNLIPFVYFSFALTVIMGLFIRKNCGMVKIAGASLVSAVLFFIVTNFGAWLVMPVYTKNMSGLMASYVAAIPFFGNTLMSHMFYSMVLFAGISLVKYFAIRGEVSVKIKN